MTPESSSVVTISPLLHCQFRFPCRRFCRLPISDNDSGLCFKHANQQRKESDLAELASALTGKSEGFQTAAGINHSLGELYKLLADNKIAPRRAAVLAYISNLLLHTLPAMDRETAAVAATQIGSVGGKALTFWQSAASLDSVGRVPKNGELPPHGWR